MAGSLSKRYPPELRERAVRMVGEIRGEHDSEWAAMQAVPSCSGWGRPRRSASGSVRPRSTTAHVLA